MRDALVVGINIYKDDNLHNLLAPASDAEAIGKILSQYGKFQVWLMPEAIDSETKKPFIAKTRELSLTQLQKALVKLFKPEGRQIPDTALFYFSGHGLRQDLGIQEGFLATSDVYPQLGFNGLSLQWLRRLLQESPVRQQIIWLDCCHSGEILNFDEADPGEQGHGRDRCFIAASREFEQSYEDLNSNYSVLTKFLLDGLDPNPCPQQWVTNYSLVDFINKNLRNENQRPVFTNFGSPINLTRTLDTETHVSKGQDSKDICPYKGLEYFDFNDEDPKYFYGREKLTDKLLDRVRQSNFLAILGASGSGKSSVLRAGLLHQLNKGRKLAGSENWKIQIMLPGEHPLQNLALSWLDSNLSDTERAKQLDDTESLLQQGGEGLRKLVQASRANQIVLVIDQFEEAFTLCQDLAEREAFFQCLLEALEQTDNKLCLILAMRIDFFGKCFEREYSGLGNKIQAKDNFIAIPPMKREELFQAIIKPAEKVKLSLESPLAEEILRDIEGSPASLPLLQDTLTELWKRRTNNQLKFATYSKLAGIGGTLNQRATEVYNSLSESEQDTARHIFLCLTQLGEGTEDTRRRVLKKDLITAKHDEQLIDNVVQTLAKARLIVTRERVDPSSAIGKEAEVDVAHETLIRNWISLRQWLDESREQLRQKRKIEDAAIEWQTSGKKTDYLLSKKRLRSAKEFQKEQQENYPLSKLAESFIAESIKHQRRESIKSLGLFLIIPLIGTAMVGYFVFREIQLNADKRLIRDCEGKKDCPGRIGALERLVEAGRSIKNYRLYDADLTDANLRGADLAGADLRGAYLADADLTDADLTDANLRGAYLADADLTDADLTNADLTGADLASAYLRGAYLTYAYLTRVNLTGADLTGADLASANLRGAYLADADLTRANLTYADFTGADLTDAYLTSAYLTSAYLTRADLTDADLTSAYLAGAYLTDAYLTDADLTYAYLTGADLTGADLTGADLAGADLTGADLTYAYLTYADLTGADLTYAYLIKVQNLTSSGIKSACFWEEVIYKGEWNVEKKTWVAIEPDNTNFIEELKKDTSSDPKKPPDCSRWR